MKKNVLLVLMTCMVFAGCSKSDDGGTLEPSNPVTPNEPTKIPINVATNVWTRATDSAFEINDKVGIYVVNFNGSTAGTLDNMGNYVDNMCFTYSGSWVPATPIYWLDQTTKADFYCYYPYASVVNNITAYPFAVKADQSTDGNYKASEFLWGKRESVTPTAEPVQITVKHAMSNLIVKLQAGQGYTDADMERAIVTILGMKTNATVNLATGVATATGSAYDILPKQENYGYRALIVPQSVSNAPLIKVTIDENQYVLTQTMTFEANKQHTCTLTVNRTGNGINIGIGGWDSDDIDHGGTVE